MESYIVINGKKAPLTEEQLKMLGIETEKKSPFKRDSEYPEEFFYIEYNGEVIGCIDYNTDADNACFDVANYCTDKNLLQQRAWHEILNRLLWRYSMEHDGDKIDWNNHSEWKYYIYFNIDLNKYAVDCHRHTKDGMVYFHTSEIANNAFEEIIKPFMKEHPDFVW